MTMVTSFNVEMHTRSGKSIYLCQFGDGMEWTSNPDDAFEYDDVEEANADALRYGGEVLEFERHQRPSDVILPSQSGFNPIVRGANIAQRGLVAAE